MCLAYIEGLVRWALGLEKDTRRIAAFIGHVRTCAYCRANLDVFGAIVEKKAKERRASSCSCEHAAGWMQEATRAGGPLRPEVLQHLASCRPCRERFVREFVERVESDPSFLPPAATPPHLVSPLVLAELRKEKRQEVINAIRNAEASLVTVKPDGGIRYGLHELIEKRIESLPPYPEHVHHILELIDEDADLALISKEISKDVSIAARILQIANSQHYRGRHPIDDLQRALSRIGLQVVSRIIRIFGLHASVMAQAGQRLTGYDIPMKSFMNYSTMVAVIAMTLAPKYGAASEENGPMDLDMMAYTAGLVSNLGMIVLDRCIDKASGVRLREAVASGHEVTAVERALLGITHPEVSARILRKWNLSEPFIQGVLAHHSRSADGPNTLADILEVADTIASDFLTPTSRVRPFLHLMPQEDLLARLPFNGRGELERFYRSELRPAFDLHGVQYKTMTTH